MVAFCRAFLVRSTGTTVEQLRPAVSLHIEFNGFWIGEFGAVVSKAEPEKIHKAIRSQFQIEQIWLFWQEKRREQALKFIYLPPVRWNTRWERISLEIVEGSLSRAPPISVNEVLCFNIDSMVVRSSRVRCLLLAISVPPC